MEKREAVGTILLAMLISACVIGAMSAGVPGNLASKAIAILIVVAVAGAVAAGICFVLMRRK